MLLVSLAAAHPAAAIADSADRIAGKSPRQLGVPAAALPDLTMKAGLLCTEDGDVLWSRRPKDRRAMASITKVMTAVIVMEKTKPEDKVIITEKAKRTDYPSPYFRAGDRATVSELLESLLVKSANDAASALAEHVAGDTDKFVDMMNAKAGELGLERTHFTNTHGLDAEDHYSTAADLAVLTRYAMQKPEFRRIVGLQKASIEVAGHSTRVESTNLLIGHYDGANGVKTGWTDDAGHSVVASARRNGVELYAVVLGTKSEQARFKDARELLDWGFAHYREQRLSTKGSVLAESPVLDYLDVLVPAAVSRNTTAAVFDLKGPVTRTVSVGPVKAPVSAGDKLGVVTFTQAGRVIETVPLVAEHAVAKPGMFERFGISTVRIWRKITRSPLPPVAVRMVPAE